jgi:hypothetical protein
MRPVTEGMVERAKEKEWWRGYPKMENVGGDIRRQWYNNTKQIARHPQITI